jgi:hypothetical protein
MIAAWIFTIPILVRVAGVIAAGAADGAGEAVGADPVCANVAIESTATTTGTKREV